MGVSDELDYLKSLVSQLNDKIAAIEAKAKPSPSKTPAQQLRTILVGPPGAGKNDEADTLRDFLNHFHRERNTGA